MVRAQGRKQISFTVSAAQHAAFLDLAQQCGYSPSDFMRKLLESEAEAHSMAWPDDLPGHGGKRERKAEGK